MAEDRELLVKCLNALASVYRSMMLKRYDLFADGGGNWKPLSPVTLAKRRKGKGGGSDKILIDTKGLIEAVGSMTAIGASNYINGSCITVGFSDEAHDGGESYNQVATLHQNGGWTIIDGHRVFVPQRKILVPPDTKQQKFLAAAVSAEIDKYIGKN